MDIEALVQEGLLQRIKPSPDLAEKEFEEADYDMGRARKALEEKDSKWAIIKAYYAVFHSAKGILFLMGLREKSHFGLGEALDALCDEGKLESRYVADFKAASSARQAADYRYDHSEKTAAEIISLAEEFLEKMGKLRRELGRPGA